MNLESNAFAVQKMTKKHGFSLKNYSKNSFLKYCFTTKCNITATYGERVFPPFAT